MKVGGDGSPVSRLLFSKLDARWTGWRYEIQQSFHLPGSEGEAV